MAMMRKSWLPLILFLCLALAAGAQEKKGKKGGKGGGGKGKGKKGGEPGAVQPGAPGAPNPPQSGKPGAATPEMKFNKNLKADDELLGIAIKFLEAIKAKQADTVLDQMDENIKKAVTPEKITEMMNKVWEEAEAKLGPFQKVGTSIGISIKKGAQTQLGAGVSDVRIVPLTFEKETVDLWVVFTPAKKVMTVVTLPPSMDDQLAAEADKAAAAAAATAAAGREEEVIVGAGTPWALPGTLIVPTGGGPFPALVLVHGSGPNDRDETVGANKPFRDLAKGLADKGVATLRYEKRTKQHALEMAGSDRPITVKEEVLDDALAAVALLRGQAKIDKNKIIVLGHSLGGMLAPRIAQGDPGIAGLIVMAGNARPLEDLVLTQTVYLATLNGPPTEEGRKQVAEIQAEVNRVKTLQPGKTRPMFVMGVAPEYWLDLRAYNPVETAKAVAKPMLFLQGERDYQVTGEDFKLWQAALAGRPDVTFKLYRGLNHLFILGSGKSIPAEYNMAGQVAQPVIDDIAGWVKGMK